MQRSAAIHDIRPNLKLEETKGQTEIELFQNEVLRPILKLQNDLVVHRFLADILTLKFGFDGKDDVGKSEYVTKRLKTDIKLKKEYLGLISGLMTMAEYRWYLENHGDCNRRIVSMLIKRLIDNTRSPKSEW